MICILRTIHQGKIQLCIDYSYGLPVIRVDVRRLRILPYWRSLCAAVNPILSLFCIAGLCYELSQADINYNGWFFIGFLAFSTAAFLLLCPWSSTALTRELSLRLRHHSPFSVMLSSLQKVLFSWIRPTPIIPDFWVQIAWGAWSLIYLLTLAIVINFTLQFDFNLLATQLFQENHKYILILLFIALSLLCASLVATAFTLMVRYTKILIRELHYRFWPQYDYLLIGAFICFFGIILSPLLLWKFFQWRMIETATALFCGLIWLLSGIIAWRKEGRSFDASIYIPCLLAGIILIAFSYSEIPTSFVNIESSTINFFYWVSQTQPFFTEATEIGFLLLLILFWCYLSSFMFWFFSPFSNPKHSFFRNIYSGCIIGIVLGIPMFFVPFNDSSVGLIAIWLYVFIGIQLFGFILLWGNLRNGSTTLIGLACFLLLWALFQDENITSMLPTL